MKEHTEMKKTPRTLKRSTARTASKPANDHPQVFDDEGVKMAILAALECVYECFPHITLPQYLIALEVRKAERDGEPHTLASLLKKQLVTNHKNLPNQVPVAVTQAMLNYYGDTVRQLRRSA